MNASLEREHEIEPFLRVLVHAAAGRKAVWQASWWRRLAASLVDVVVFSPVVIVATMTYVRWSGNRIQLPTDLAWYDAVAVTVARHLGSMLGVWVVMAASWSITRYIWLGVLNRTPGMIWLQLDFWGMSKPGPVRLWLREVLNVLFLTCFAIGPLWAIFDESHRSLADVLSGIYCVDAEKHRFHMDL